MASRSQFDNPEKSLAQLFAECKDELKDFAATRIAMLRAEMREKLSAASAVLPAIAAGAALLLLAVVFLAVALVAVVAMLLGGGTGAWAGAFAIVAGAFLLIGGIAVYAGVKKLKASSLKPERTLRVLKRDQVWLQNEARNQR
jgi:hypothetical protein